GGQVQRLGSGPGATVDVPDQQLRKNRILVREVLIQRADGHPGVLGDAVGGAGGVAVLGENVSSGGEDALPRELGAHLPRLATWGETAFGGGHPWILPGRRKRVAKR